MDLDYRIQDDDGRVRAVSAICDERGSSLSPRELEALADYLLRTRERGTTVREHSKEYPITTYNRNVTHTARSVSLDVMGDSAELFAMPGSTTTGPPSPALDPITERDILTVPGLAENRVMEARLRDALDTAVGHRRRQIKSQLIETWREAYFLRAMHRGTDSGRVASRVMRDMAHVRLDGEVFVGDDGYPVDTSPITYMRPEHVSCILQWYSLLWAEVRDAIDSDVRWMLVDFAALVRRTLPPGTPLHDLAALRASGYQLKDMPDMMYRLHGISKNANQWNYVLTHTVSNAIARRAQKEWLVWHYSNVEYGEWKRCGRCGKWKLAHPLFWTRDKGKFYSICKECRKTPSKEPGDVHLARREVRSDA